jgi:predicted GIY-YIG superfamily endonuclease
MTPHSVYWIHHPTHTDMFSQGYVGVSVDAERRFDEHLKKSDNRHLKFAINKYGWDTLVKRQILIADKQYCLEVERKLRPDKSIGWNCAIGGGNPPNLLGRRFVRTTPIWNKGLKMSAEHRAKVSKAVKEQMNKPGAREFLSSLRKGLPCPMKGKKHKPETIEKMRIAKLGKPSTRKGVPHPLEAIEKAKATFKANPWTCPHCGKIGLNKGAGNRWHFDNCKEK